MSHAVIGFQIHLFVFHTAPKTLDEHIVQPAAFAVHADLDIVAFEHASELLTGELAALVGIEYVGRAMLGDGFFQRLYTEVAVHRVRKPPGQDYTRMPVHDCSQIGEASGHGYIRNVSGPNLVWSINSQVSEEVGIDPVGLIRKAEVAFRINSHNAHGSHQALHSFAVYGEALITQPVHCSPAAVER